MQRTLHGKWSAFYWYHLRVFCEKNKPDVFCEKRSLAMEVLKYLNFWSKIFIIVFCILKSNANYDGHFSKIEEKKEENGDTTDAFRPEKNNYHHFVYFLLVLACVCPLVHMCVHT